MRSPEEIKFDDLCDKYWDKFGEAYGLTFGDGRTLADHIRLLEDALETGKPIPTVFEGVLE